MRRLLTISLILSLLLIPLLSIRAGSTAGSLIAIESMHQPRSCHTSTLLDDGTVLITGGMVRERQFLASAELFDPLTAQFSEVGSLSEPRACHVAVKLKDGRVLILGSGTQTVSATADLYNPEKRTFSAAGTMSHPRSGFTATLLLDGRVLITGGSDYRSTWTGAEIFDPATDTFTPTGDLIEPRTVHTATLLPDGKVLIAGGQVFRQQTVYASTEIYDPVTGKFSAGAPMQVARHKHAAVSLSAGDVLLIGGADVNDWSGRLDSVERYDHKLQQFVSLDRMRAERFKLMDAVVTLPDGNVLIAGGSTLVESFDPAAHSSLTAQGRLDEARFYQTTTLLADGRVLISGGYGYDIQATAKSWLWTP
ncbi:MAG: hypothetical protein KF726_00025 [Anaerolineae bacterium]|nr:hypothetical protein [Anaerolineae bacterium]